MSIGTHESEVFDRRFLEAFQVEDIARLCMKGGGLLSWEQGLGKTIASLIFAKAIDAKRVLIVAPQDIVAQWRREASQKFMVDLNPIPGVRQAIRVRERIRAGHTGFFVTWYEALSQAGKIEEMGHIRWEKDTDEKGREIAKPMVTTPGRRGDASLEHCPNCGMMSTPDYKIKRGRGQRLFRDIVAKHGGLAPRWLSAHRLRRDEQKVQWRLDIKQGQNGPRVTKATCERCGYTHWSKRLKPAAYWLRDLFDLIVVDEGTKIKNMNSQTSLAIQGMRAPHRLLLSGTPLKNYVSDAYSLLRWVAGDNSPSFPYGRKDGQAKFEEDFATIEYTIDKKHRNRELGRKVLPQISNLIGLWKVIGANCIRRTKANAGVPIVPIIWHDLRMPFGLRQAAAYELWVRDFVAWFVETHPTHPLCEFPKIIQQRSAILGLFAKLQFMCTLPEAEPEHWASRQGLNLSNWTPKNVAVIRTAAQMVDEGRKVVIFSAVKEHSMWMSRHLNCLGYQSLSIVEDRNGKPVTLGPQGRADLVRDFKEDGHSILCASIHAMNLGHNLDVASAVIVNGLPWDFATFDQAIARVHRITSRAPVDVFIAQSVCNPNTDDFRAGASLDQKMRRLLRDKGDSAALGLDGAIPERNEVVVDQQAFLNDLSKEWKSPTECLDESVLQAKIMDIAR